MLESAILMLHESSLPTGAPCINVTGSGQQLGLARKVESQSLWCRLFSGGTFEVCETQDHSVIFTMTRWRQTWHVTDAESHPVGAVQRDGSVMCDAAGRRTSIVACSKGLRFISIAGIEVATSIQVPPGAWQVTFGPDLADEPFLKMLVLAATLARML